MLPAPLARQGSRRPGPAPGSPGASSVAASGGGWLGGNGGGNGGGGGGAGTGEEKSPRSLIPPTLYRFGSSKPLRSTHIDTLEVLRDYQSENQRLVEENASLRGALDRLQSGECEQRIRDLERRLAEAEGRAAAHFCRQKQLEEAHSETLEMVKEHRAKLQRYSTIATNARAGLEGKDEHDEPHTRSAPVANGAAAQVASRLAEAESRVVQLQASVREMQNALREADAREQAAAKRIQATQKRMLAFEQEQTTRARSLEEALRAAESANVALRGSTTALSEDKKLLSESLERERAEREALARHEKELSAQLEEATARHARDKAEVARLLLEKGDCERRLAQLELQVKEAAQKTSSSLPVRSASDSSGLAALTAAAAPSGSSAASAPPPAAGPSSNAAPISHSTTPATARSVPQASKRRAASQLSEPEVEALLRARFPEFVHLKRENARLEDLVFRLRQELMRVQRSLKGTAASVNSILPFSERAITSTLRQ